MPTCKLKWNPNKNFQIIQKAKRGEKGNRNKKKKKRLDQQNDYNRMEGIQSYTQKHYKKTFFVLQKIWKRDIEGKKQPLKSIYIKAIDQKFILCQHVNYKTAQRTYYYQLDKYTQILRKYMEDILSCKHCVSMFLYNIKETTILEIKLCSQTL